jgi:hypothetical protein
MLAGTVLDWVSFINDLGVIMNFSDHVDVMVGKAFAMLGLTRRMLFEFRDPYTLKSLYTCPWFVQSWSTPAVYAAHSITSVQTRLNLSRDGLYDMLCVVWV